MGPSPSNGSFNFRTNHVKDSARSFQRAAPVLIALASAVLLVAGCEAGGGGELSNMPLTRGASGTADPVEPGSVAEAPAPQADESEAIRRAALEYVRSETAVANVSAEVQAVGNDWARVRVVPTGGETDPALLFLRKEGGVWRGVAIGTAFAPHDLERLGVPAAVRPRS
jgi:hypothetical protein